MRKILILLTVLLSLQATAVLAAEAKPGRVVADFWTLVFRQRDFNKAYEFLGAEHRRAMSKEEFIAAMNKMFDMEAVAKNMVGTEDAAKLRAVKALLEAAMEKAECVVQEETITGDKAVVKATLKITAVADLLNAPADNSPLKDLLEFKGSDEELKAKVRQMLPSLPLDEETDTFDLLKENGEWKLNENI